MNDAMTASEISDTLWRLDPMRTGCSGNDDMRDEYEFQADEIAELTADGMPLRAAVIEVFEKWFWEGCLNSGTDTSRIDTIVKTISKIDR